MNSPNFVRGYGPSSLMFDGDERKFEQWEVRVLGYLRIKKLKGVVLPTDMENLPADDGEQNELAFAELCQFLDETSLSLVMRDARDDGRKALKILKEHYAGSSKPRVMTLYTQLTTLKKTNNESITEYILRAEKASSALKSAGEVVSDSLLIAMSLKGLPDEYKSFVTVVTQADNEYTFQKFKQSLRNFEETEKTRVKRQSEDNAVMKMNHGRGTVGGNTNKFTCFKCGLEGHKANSCKKTKLWCSNCKSKTHTDAACRKQDRTNKVVEEVAKHTYAFKIKDKINEIKNPENFLVKSDNSENPFLKLDNPENFLVDCGATTHIVNRDTNFVSVDKSFNPAEHFIELADGTRSNNVAKKRGNVSVYFRNNNGELVNAILKNVLFVPSYPQCIFSVQAATKSGSHVNFSGNSAELISENGTCFPILQKDRLYYLCKNSVHGGVRGENLETWHKLLGHCNTNDVLNLQDVVNGMNISDKSEFQCETCTLSKLTNFINKNPDTRAIAPFELVHTDLAGPVDPVAKDGFKYTIVFTDDFSGCMFTYFLKLKSDALQATKKFLADIAPYGKVKTLSFYEDVFPSGKVGKLRSDNGGEYISKDFKDLMISHNIKHELSCPHSPHQNGTAERSWRTLFDMARSMIVESKMPKYLWTYAVMAATYTRNRCYNQRTKQTPYGLITGLKPDVSKLHLFGSVCYAYIQGHKKKFDARSKKGYFLGYDKESPAFLVFYPESNSVSKHRLVKFTDKFEIHGNNVHDDRCQDVSGIPNDLKPEEEPVALVNEEVILPVADVNNDEPLGDEVILPVADVNNDEPLGDEERLVDGEVDRRYPRRVTQPPEYLRDYVSSLSSCEVDYCYMINIPSSFDDAIKSSHSLEWKDAMDSEIESLVNNETFLVTEIPEDRKVVGGRWVFTVKGDDDKPLFKARYVAQGCSQVYGVDYLETFSPTPRMESLRIVMQVSVQQNLLVHQMDVRSAYLHAPLDCEIYVKQPPGYEETGDSGKKLVWRLQKSLYGLKQSGRNWHNLLQDFLLNTGFTKSDADPCVFVQNTDEGLVILLVWVDDIILAVSSDKIMNDVKKVLKGKFSMKGPISFFLISF